MSNVPYPFHPDLVISLWVKVFEGSNLTDMFRQFSGMPMNNETFNQIENYLEQKFQYEWSNVFNSRPLGTSRSIVNPTYEQRARGELNIQPPQWFYDLFKEAQEYNGKDIEILND